MITRHILTAFFCLSLLANVGMSLAQSDDDAAQLGKRLIAALEAYNKNAGSNNPVEYLPFFDKRDLLTGSLKAALKRECDLDSDPFLNAQDVVSGFLLKDVKMGEGVARLVVAHKADEYNKADEGATFVMLKEDGSWKIDDIDWGASGTLKQACR